ncbi:MAG: hypothetical protein RLO17_24495 [Cyclobacteriaceae bacterium]|jgi:hypothetical protein|tara:strand:- start:10537 stop:11853 length:1317 start_codon:yes stop_codon:yes gene_type:complete
MENSVQQLEEVYTNISKGRDGWKGDTVIKNVNGYDWKILTSKSNSGISSTAQGGKAGENSGFATFKCSLFEDPHINLVKTDKRCTQKAVTQLHQAALLKFNELLDSGELPGKTCPDYTIELGQLIFLENNHGFSPKLAIYKIEELWGDTYYHYVNTETLELGRVETLDDYEDKKGPGYYYQREDRMDVETVFNLVQRAQLRLKQLDREKQKEDQEALQERNQKIEEGASKVHIPDHAVALIVGELKEDKSDMMTDYFAYTISKVIYLAYSNHQKDLFSEMRKAAVKAGETKDLAEAPKDWEHREKYSMGSGYYLGEHHHSGWEVRKVRFDPTNKDQCNQLFIAAAEGRYFCETAPEPVQLSDTSNDILIYHELKHTKKGHDLFVYVLTEQVDREEFLRLKSIAKASNGYYSNFRGRGAVPGFHFLKKEDADRFIQSIK